MRIFSLVYCILWIIFAGLVATLIAAMFAIMHLTNYVFEKFVVAIVIPLSVIVISAVIIYKLVLAGIDTSFSTDSSSGWWNLTYTIGFDISVAYMIYLVFGNIGKTTGNMLSIATHLRALLPTLDQKQKEGDYHEL